MTEYHVINGRAPRLDAPAKATGRAMYVDDIKLPGMLYGALLQSPLAHARIRNIDTSKALKLPGVKSVVTAEDAGMVPYGVSPARYDETLFVKDRARYMGDEIAAVAREWGAEVPFKRPAELADDYTGTVEVIAHAIDMVLAEGGDIDNVCCFSPF